MLRRCRLWQGTFSCNGRRFHVPVPTLHLDFSEPAPSLAPLLSALQPAGAAPCFFERLELLGSLPQPAALAGCNQLHQLRELSLDFRAYTAGREMDECLAVLLQQASSLSSLSISVRTAPRSPPTCLVGYHGLRRLALTGSCRVELPAGEYLSGVRAR